MNPIKRREHIYYSFRETPRGYEKYIQGRTIYFYDTQGKVIRELEYYRWQRELELSAIRIYTYDKHNRLIREEIRQPLARIIEERYHIYDKENKKTKTLNVEFDYRYEHKIRRCSTIEYEYDKRGRLERDVMNMSPMHFSKTRYFYNGAKLKPAKKTEYLQLGKGNRWRTTYYYDTKGRIIKETRWCKKGPYEERSFEKYYYNRKEEICVSSSGEKTITKRSADGTSIKSYDKNGALAGFTKIINDKDKGMDFVLRWHYECNCYGVVCYPVFQTVTKYKYRH